MPHGMKDGNSCMQMITYAAYGCMALEAALTGVIGAIM